MGGRFGELLLLFIVAMLLFGPQKLPDLAKAMGEAIREFKKAANGDTTSNSPNTSPQPAPRPKSRRKRLLQLLQRSRSRTSPPIRQSR